MSFPKPIRSAGALLAGILIVPLLAAQSADEPPGEQVYDLDGVTVFHSETDFTPLFSRQVPELSFYEVPELPMGDLILALEFLDRYRDAAVPGRAKWCGLLSFPVIDGKEQTHLKWICLYQYDDRMFGYDPGSMNETERRFAVPIPLPDRAEPEVLYRFAVSLVASIFPGGQEEYYEEEVADDPDDPVGYGGTYEVIEIPPGRIAGVLRSQKGKPPEELVRLVMQYAEDPNPRPDTDVRLGAPETARGLDVSWKQLKSELRGNTNFEYLALAAELVKPRWQSIARLHYKKDRLLLGSRDSSSRILLFNIGTRLFAYSPKFGVWRTSAQIGDVNNPGRLASLLEYPEVDTIIRCELVPPDPEVRP